MPSSVVVTGGAGFIGSELVHQLTASGHHVSVIDNLANGRRENLAGLPAAACRLVVADVRDESQVEPLLEGASIVFHLACLGVRHSVHAPRENHDVNATATLDLLRWSQRAGVGRFVYVSSSEVYGTARHAPMAEDHPTSPMTVYGASKLAGESYARAFHRTYGYPTVVVRPFNAYGPRSHHEGDSGEVIPRFMLRALAGRPMVMFGNGSQTRDFTFVADTARGILSAGQSEDAIGETLNLGSGREISVADLAREVASVVGGPLRTVQEQARPGDVQRLVADSSRAREKLGFQPRVALRDGLERLRDWYRSRPQDPAALLEQEVVRNWEPPPRA